MKTLQKQSIHSYNISKYAQQPVLTVPFEIERGETQRNVNSKVLKSLFGRLPHDARVLDLPCGKLLFLKYLKRLYPAARLAGADIIPQDARHDIEFFQMDLSREFEIPVYEKFDLITSISGIMMFGNTQKFIENCSERLEDNGLLVITNDNSLTIMDRLRYMFLGRVRMFSPYYENDEAMTQNIHIPELIRLMRINGLNIDKIEYTSFYFRDLIFVPFALLIYPIQYLYLQRLKTRLPKSIRQQMYQFRHLLCRHYIITGSKI